MSGRNLFLEMQILSVMSKPVLEGLILISGCVLY